MDTATEPITDITAVNDLPNEGGDDDDSCLRCLLRVIRSKRCIKCDICQCTYHQECIEIPVKVFDKLIANVSITGWVCDECKVAARSSYCRLEAAVAHLTEELAVVQSELAVIKSSRHPDNDNNTDDRNALTIQRTPSKSSCRDHSVVIATEEIAVIRSELADIKQRMTTTSYILPPPSDVSVASVNSPQEPDHHISLVVHRTLKDAAKRKRNVIVTGMPEDPTTSDREQFVSLCEGFLSIKPYVVSCKRLGEIVEGRIRKLLVRLNTDAAAIELLRCAHRLRHATDSTVSSIYIVTFRTFMCHRICDTTS